MTTPKLVLQLDLPEATPSNNVIKGMHFRAYKKLRESWQWMVQGAILEAGYASPGPLQRAYIQVDRYSAGGGLDWDNAYGGLKPLMDCLVQASERNPNGLGIILDDSPAHIPEPPYIAQHPAKRGEGRTVLRVYDCTGDVRLRPTWLKG